VTCLSTLRSYPDAMSDEPFYSPTYRPPEGAPSDTGRTALDAPGEPRDLVLRAPLPR